MEGAFLTSFRWMRMGDRLRRNARWGAFPHHFKALPDSYHKLGKKRAPTWWISVNKKLLVACEDSAGETDLVIDAPNRAEPNASHGCFFCRRRSLSTSAH